MLKCIILGAGMTGQIALSFLGNNRVECFVDNYKSGSELCGRPILSFQELLTMDLNRYVIAVASEKYSKDLIKQLTEANIENFFVFREKDYWEINNVLPSYMIYKKRESKSYAWVLAQFPIRIYISNS